MDGTGIKPRADICHLAHSQLSLFVQESTGNTLLDYDTHPKFIHKQAKCLSLVELRDSGFISVVVDGQQFEIIPANIQRENPNTGTLEIVSMYPSTREAVIEECILLFANRGEFSISKGEPGFRFDGTSIKVLFTLHQLRSELESMGKAYKASELREGLNVLSLARYRIRTPDYYDREQMFSYIIQSLDHIDVDQDLRTDVIRGDRIYCVTLDSRATKKIMDGHYRSYDAGLSLSLNSPIARHVYKKLIHAWLNASCSGTGSVYVLCLEDTLLMAGYPLSSNITKRRLALENALVELAGVGILQPLREGDVVLRKHGRKVTDVEFCIRPTPAFVSQQIRGHEIFRRSRDVGEKIAALPKTNQLKSA